MEELETSLAQKKSEGGRDEPACFCYGDPVCRVPRCPQKDTLSFIQWFNPEMAEEYGFPKCDSHTQFEVNANVDSVQAFSGLKVSEKCDEEIFDSGSTITLCTEQE